MAFYFYQDNHVTIEWDEIYQCVVAHWTGFADSDVYRNGAMKELELIKLKKAAGLISDTRNLRAVSLDDQNWTVESWGPRVAEAGLRKIAMIIPSNIFGQISVKGMISRAEGRRIETRYFETLEEAGQWITSSSSSTSSSEAPDRVSEE